MMRDQQFSPEEMAQMLDGPATPKFAQALLTSAKAAGRIVETFMFRWSEGEAPKLLSVAGDEAGSLLRATTYLQRYFHHDPMFFQHRHAPIGTGFSETYAREAIAPREYQQRCFTEPGISYKHSFGWRWPSELVIVNFYSRGTSIVAMSLLGQIASIALVCARRQPAKFNTRIDRRWIADRMQHELPALTARETEVCTRTILGENSAEISRALGIGQASVLTYRRRAYAKAEVSNAGQILSRLLAANS